MELALRDGPIEDVHAGRTCPTYHDQPQYSGITQSEMKKIMTNAVNSVYTLLKLQQDEPKVFAEFIQIGATFASDSDEPIFDTTLREFRE